MMKQYQSIEKHVNLRTGKSGRSESRFENRSKLEKEVTMTGWMMGESRKFARAAERDRNRSNLTKQRSSKEKVIRNSRTMTQNALSA
jgi:hypothetical protein